MNTQVSAGDFEARIRLTSGAVKCWGLNDNGQLGDGTTTQRLTPVAVSGLTSNGTSMAIGYAHSCTRVIGGGLKCWGSNSNGQLSDGTVTYSTTPLVIAFTGYTYTYGNSAHKHAVTALSSGESYTYDANGSMTTRIEGGITYTQNYDAENRLISVNVTGQALPTLFIYDGDGNLIKKIKPDNSRTLYPSTSPRKAAAPLRAGVGGIYEGLDKLDPTVDKNSGGAETGTKTYYPATGATLAPACKCRCARWEYTVLCGFDKLNPAAQGSCFGTAQHRPGLCQCRDEFQRYDCR